jgi:hypothetical protein
MLQLIEKDELFTDGGDKEPSLQSQEIESV